MNELILTVGLPRSGKTTWARQQGAPIVNPDSIRLALHGERFIGIAEPFVWAIAKCMVTALFLAGHRQVIVDATNTTVKRRDEWRFGKWSLAYKVIETSREECVRRAMAENDAYILPTIDRMAGQVEWPTDVESARRVGESLEADVLAAHGLDAEGRVA